MADLSAREEGERERSSIKVQTLAAQSSVGLGGTMQGALGLGCAIWPAINNPYPKQKSQPDWGEK